jgi:putative heme-binding domain-containing protein
MVIYIRSLSRNTAVAITGNPEKGKAVYQRSGCSACHIINGEGGNLGPELTSIGAHRAPDYLRQAIVDPAATLPRGVMAFPGHGFNEFLPIRVVTRDGREVRGLRVNEDSFTIQVRDTGNQLHSFRKADLQNLEKEIGQSLMPDYKSKISGSDLDDLVAYLSSLGGAR